KLDVAGNVAMSGNLLLNSSPLNAGLRGFNLTGDGVLRMGLNMPNLMGEGDNTKQGAFFTIDSRAGESVLAIFTKQANSSVESERLTIKSNGNVGIGNPTPAATLDVNGNMHTTGTLFFNDGSPQFTAGIT